MICSRFRPPGLILWAVLFLSAPGLIPLSYQDRDNETSLQHQVMVTLKLVQVYVTDKKGNPVQDLNREDFLLQDNGEKKNITEFEKHDLTLFPDETQAQAPLQDKTQASYPDSMNRKFFLLFDFAYNNAKGIQKAKKAALHFLDSQVQASDEVGVLSYSSIRSLTLHEYLTRDHHEIKKLVGAFGTENRAGRAETFEGDYWFRVTGENPLDPSQRGKITFKEGAQVEDRPVTGPATDFDKFQTQEDSNVHAIHFVQKMKDFAEALNYIPGYKHIVLFSSGIPYSLIYGIHHPNETWNVTKGRETINKQAWDFGNSLLRQRYEDMLKALSSSNSTVYTIDTEDLAATVGIQSRLSGGYTLQTMAHSSGGEYFGDINSYQDHMEKIQKITGGYYVLGYYIDEQWDGKYHKIKIRVNRPGLTVNAQKGYFNPKPYSSYTKLEKKLHLVDLALNERSEFQVPLRFPMVSLPLCIDGSTHISMFAKLPTELIHEFAEKDIELVSLVFDEKNSIIKMGRNKKDFSKISQENMYYADMTSLPPGDYQCRLVLRNPRTGQGAVASSKVMVPGIQGQGIKLFPPLLLKEDRNARFLENPPAVYPFDPLRHFPVVEVLGRATKSLLAAVRCSFSGASLPDIQLSANLIRDSGEAGDAVPVSISILEKYHNNDTLIYILEIQTEGLEPGGYFLHLFAADKLMGTRSHTNTAFAIN